MHLSCSLFAQRVVECISLRFPNDSQTIIGALSYLYPQKIAFLGQNEEFRLESAKAMRLLANHYSAKFDTSNLEIEYMGWVSLVKNTFPGVSADEFLWAMYNTLSSELDGFPIIRELLQISLTIPPGSVDCERGFSTQNIIKTKLRNCLSIETTAALLRCSMDGNDIQNFTLDEHLVTFLESKKRRIE